MKQIRSLLLLAACLITARVLSGASTGTLATAISIALPVLLFQSRRTQAVAYSRATYALMILLILVLTRHDVTPLGQKPDFAFNPNTKTTTISADFIDQIRAERQALRDSDPEKWRQEMRERLERMRR